MSAKNLTSPEKSEEQLVPTIPKRAKGNQIEPKTLDHEKSEVSIEKESKQQTSLGSVEVLSPKEIRKTSSGLLKHYFKNHQLENNRLNSQSVNRCNKNQ